MRASPPPARRRHSLRPLRAPPAPPLSTSQAKRAHRFGASHPQLSRGRMDDKFQVSNARPSSSNTAVPHLSNAWPKIVGSMPAQPPWFHSRRYRTRPSLRRKERRLFSHLTCSRLPPGLRLERL
jgi:hypothetical protein